MKNILYGLFLMLFVLSACKENVVAKIKADNVKSAKERDYKINEGAAAITFSKPVYDFGVVEEGDIVETTFEFQNTGKTALIISDATSTCGCTVPEWPKEPIGVGGTGYIKVKFDTAGKPNLQSKIITLNTNTKSGKEIVEIKGTVNPKKAS